MMISRADEIKSEIVRKFGMHDWNRPIRAEFTSLEQVELIVLVEAVAGIQIPDLFLLEMQNMTFEQFCRRVIV